MRTRIPQFFCTFVLLLCICTAKAQMADPVAGISLDLAQRRAEMLSNLSYSLSLSIPETLTEPITGSNTIRFMLTDAGKPLVLDFVPGPDHIFAVEANGQAASYTQVKGHIVIAPAALTKGANILRIAFRAGDAPLNRNLNYLYTLFVPARARLALPCFDQPDLKGRWSLALDHPAAWQSTANGAQIERIIEGNRAFVRFAPTPPLPTYLFAFAAGDFKVETAQRGGHTLRMFHREPDAAKLARNREVLFDLHGRALSFMKDYTALPYAFGKLDFVLIPGFQFGGMEHAGNIFYDANNLLLDESATQNQLLARASVISHEVAHMWFGDLVTMRWFDDVWMKEVFANFMAAKMVNPSFPELNHELRFFLSHYPRAYAVDRTPGANPIRQDLGNLDEAGSMYGAIIYQKAPIVMRHLEALLGEDKLRDGLRDFLNRHAFANASWPELIDVLAPRAPLDLRAWSQTWVEQPGLPTIQTELELEPGNGRITRLAFRQSDPRGKSRVWPQQLRIAIADAESRQPYSATLTQDVVEVPQAVGLPAPSYVLPGAAGWAYGQFRLDRGTITYLLAALPAIDDPLARGSAWVSLWDALLDRQIRPLALFDLALHAVPKESDEQLTAQFLEDASRLWWRFLTADERRQRATRFEQILRQGLDQAGTTSRKATWFATLRNIAQTAPTLTWLHKVWNRETTVPGLPLAETDEINLALDLALRQANEAHDLLTAQLRRIQNPDRKERFAFLLPAVSPDPLERRHWFESLADLSIRHHEKWVVDGLRYLHHPLRAQASQAFVRPGLEMLREIQQTGDIFFPKTWLDATLGGHNSAEVTAIVRDFLRSRPDDYPVRLKMLTLQSADELFRASDILRN
ncbi:MAG: M1 family aminopeptidase [Sterolibacterium sp.]